MSSTEKKRLVGEDGGPIPDAGGVGEVFVTERASATPSAPLARTAAPRRSLEPAVRPVTGPLALIQRWFSEVITHPGSVERGAEQAESTASQLATSSPTTPVPVPVRVPIEAIVKPNAHLSALERLAIYHHAYHSRLVECLADDYPAIQYALGTDGFSALARRYIEAHPSNHPSLNFFGARFADFCRRQGSSLQNHGFIADLARLEWAMVEVLHAGAPPPISLETIATLAPEDWPRLTLAKSATLRFLQLEHPVNAFFQAWRDGDEPEIPAAQPSATAVYRKGYSIWRMDFTPEMAAVLSALLDGQPLGEALATMTVSPVDEEARSADVRAWFQAWVASGFFASAQVS